MRNSFTYAVVLILIFQMITLAKRSSFYMPLNIQEAYEKGTRSYDGRPGPNYWQNSADYKIDVELIPYAGYIIGDARIVYHNNSPDSLDQIVFRLYQNNYKKGNARQFRLEERDLTNGVQLHYLTINNSIINLSDENKKIRKTGTNLIVKLGQRLPPKEELHIAIGWSFTLPKYRKIRMGQYSDTDFFVAYWYPQIAVYDDIDGWDLNEYYGTVEFYNDFNNYEVSIIVPAGYVVWATGTLQNPGEVLQKKILQRWLKAQKSDEVVHIITTEDYKNGSVTQEGLRNTWRFKANNVPDFSFAASNHYLWDAVSVEVDEKTGRRVITAAVYPDGAPHFEEAAEFSRATIEYLSKELPGIPYPYPHVTTFCNGGYGGGMETPMMANDGAPKKRAQSIGLIFHEISHNYFPFYMGTNERKYAWMDEGWASFFPKEVVERLEQSYDYQKGIVEKYNSIAGQEKEVSLMIPSYLVNDGSSYRTHAYYRPAIAYTFLKDLLGEKLFKKALQEYIRRWNGKHPIPYDFFFTFEDVAGKSLQWFWEPWFFQRGYPDLAIKKVQQSRNKIKVTVERLGRLPVPVELNFHYQDETSAKIYKSINIWENNKNEVIVIFHPEKNVQKISLGNAYIPDVNPENNTYEFSSSKPHSLSTE